MPEDSRPEGGQSDPNGEAPAERGHAESAARAYRTVAIGRAERVEELLAERDALLADLRGLMDRAHETILVGGLRDEVVSAADLRTVLEAHRVRSAGVPVGCPGTRFPDGTRCGEHGWHARDCPARATAPGPGAPDA